MLRWVAKLWYGVCGGWLQDPRRAWLAVLASTPPHQVWCGGVESRRDDVDAVAWLMMIRLSLVRRRDVRRWVGVKLVRDDFVPDACCHPGLTAQCVNVHRLHAPLMMNVSRLVVVAVVHTVPSGQLLGGPW